MAEREKLQGIFCIEVSGEILQDKENDLLDFALPNLDKGLLFNVF